MTALAGGSAAVLAAALLVAGIAKLADPHATARAAGRITRRAGAVRRDVLVAAARLLGGIEVATAVLLVGGRGRVAVGVATWTALLCIGFVGVVVAAARRGAACGCFGAFNDGPAAGADIARTVALALIAVTLAVTRAARPGGPAFSRASAAAGAALAAFVLLAAVAGGRLSPRGATSRRGALAALALGLGRGAPLAPGTPRALGGRARRRLVERLRAEPMVREAVSSSGGTVDWASADVVVRSPDATTQVPVTFLTTGRGGVVLRICLVGDRLDFVTAEHAGFVSLASPDRPVLRRPIAPVSRATTR